MVESEVCPVIFIFVQIKNKKRNKVHFIFMIYVFYVINCVSNIYFIEKTARQIKIRI